MYRCIDDILICLYVYTWVFFLRTMHKNWSLIKTISGNENKVKSILYT